MLERTLKNIAIYALIVLIALFAIKWTSPPEETKQEIDYNAFYQAVLDGKVKSVTITPKNGVYLVEGEYKDGKAFTTTAFLEENLPEVLREHKVAVDPQPTPEPAWWTGLLTTFLPVLLLIGFMVLMMQQTQGGGNRVMQFGRSRARMMNPDARRVTFQDVAGADEAKEELQEVIDFLTNPSKFVQIGAKIPKGVLLYGPPGTGKTLLAKAVAGEAGVPFFSISGSDFVEMFVGVGASRVRDLFEQAKKNSPCIVFIDEIDAVGRQRGAGLGGGHDEREQTLNQLLVEMDGFSTNEGIIVMAATNRPDILDPALLRPGRFDRHITIDRPDVKGRQAILEVHIRNKPIDPDIDLEVLAKRTPGFTGADLANMVNEAALLAARRNKRSIGMQEMEEAIERVIAGPEKKSRVISESEKRLVAYHEAGHAVVSYFLEHTDKLHKISIIPRGRAGGYTLLLPEEDRNYITKSKLLDDVVVLMGGRVAESLVLNEISTGAQNDLQRATDIVRRMITEYGMSEELGPLTFGRRHEEVFLGRDLGHDRNYSEAIAFAIDKEARAFVETAYNRAKEILETHIDKLHQVANRLMEVEIMDGEEFRAIMEGENSKGES
ncbi:MAG: ATP-dependent metallopeptidase FtsH/Yme1/Tma family protein [Syntrophomonadaceae bacterium]|nr:ATP-dependent metallopeptidase FtsH/Yme1/Tma family protein [Syntrophomonadaceae bacterium]